MKLANSLNISNYHIDKVTKGIEDYLWETLFKYVFKALNGKSVVNSKSDLINALKTGKIYYSNGAFRSKTTFSNNIANELEKIGAKFKYNAYYISESSIPFEISEVISYVTAQEAVKIATLNKLFIDFTNGLFDVPFEPFIQASVELAFRKLEKDILTEALKNNVPIIELGLAKPKVDLPKAKIKAIEEYWDKVNKLHAQGLISYADKYNPRNVPNLDAVIGKLEEPKLPKDEDKYDKPLLEDLEIKEDKGKGKPLEEKKPKPKDEEPPLPKLDLTIDDVVIDYRSKKIAEDYTYNMNYWVQNWKINNIIKMREDILKMYEQGKRISDFQEYFQKRWGIAKNKAKFLAQNEYGLVSSTVQSAIWQETGAKEFIWIRSVAIEKRKLHEKYYNKRFRFDNTPIIDEKLNIRGLPRQIWNCQCQMRVVVPTIKDIIEARNGQKNIITKIRNAITGGQRNNSAWRYRRFGKS